jgi:hypothetical protein
VVVFFLFIVLVFSPEVSADQIKLAGSITQSTPGGTGPASNNPSLNNIADGDTYMLLLNFSGSISGPGRVGEHFRTVQAENHSQANCPRWRAHCYVLSVSEATVLRCVAPPLTRENIERF